MLGLYATRQGKITPIKELRAASSVTNLGYILRAVYLYLICNSNLNLNLNLNTSTNLYTVLEPTAAYYFNPLLFTGLYLLNVAGIFLPRRLFVNADYRASLRTLREDYPALTLILLAAVRSFIGLPPRVGFYAKYILILSALKASTPVSVGLVLRLLIASVLSAGYYLAFFKHLYNNSTYIYNSLSLYPCYNKL